MNFGLEEGSEFRIALPGLSFVPEIFSVISLDCILFSHDELFLIFCLQNETFDSFL